MATSTTGDMQILKKAVRSLCPVCFAEITARITREGREVFMEKSCPLHGPSRTLVERDSGFYDAAVRAARLSPPCGGRGTESQLVIFPTYRCNMKCAVCYVPRRDRNLDMTREEIANLLDRWPGQGIAFGGGEPTVMENLPGILELAREKGKTTRIVTNGIRLADPDYVSLLVRSGLGGVTMSLNAMDRRILRTVDGDDVLDEKMCAVANLKKSGVRFSLSMSVARGVNEGELGAVFRFALAQFPHARSFLVENCPQVGRSLNGSRICLSELVGMFAECLGVPPGLFLELAALEKAVLNLHAFRFHYGDLLGIRSRRNGYGWHNPFQRLFLARRDAGFRTAARIVADGIGAHRSFRVRLLSAINTDNYDEEEAAFSEETRLLAVTKESPLMPLWEYLSRFHPAEPRGGTLSAPLPGED